MEKLHEFIHLDIYGGCYDDGLKCGKNDSQGCWDMIAKEYTFYLAFENSICKEYVTEKFFDPFQRSIIPIVLGGANYSQIAPTHSYIDAFKYHSEDPESLANLLKNISSDDTLYASYFWWKRFYSVGGFSAQDRAKAPCTVCEMLHQQKVEQEEVYQDLERWWVEEGDCQTLSYDRKILDIDEDDEDDEDLQDMLLDLYR